jgi:hypothetical protein
MLEDVQKLSKLLVMFRSMKRPFKIITLIASLVIAVAVWQPAKKLLLEDSCLDGGGKWASNGNYCIYRDCASNGSCKPNYQNNLLCESLRPGITQDELFFHLGMPESRSGNLYVFTGGGAQSNIKAVIKDGIVRDLQCRA